MILIDLLLYHNDWQKIEVLAIFLSQKVIFAPILYVLNLIQFIELIDMCQYFNAKYLMDFEYFSKINQITLFIDCYIVFIFKGLL